MIKVKLFNIFLFINIIIFLIPVASIYLNIEWPPIPFLDVEPVFVYMLITPFLINYILYIKYKNFSFSITFSIILYILFYCLIQYELEHLFDHFSGL